MVQRPVGRRDDPRVHAQPLGERARRGQGARRAPVDGARRAGEARASPDDAQQRMQGEPLVRREQLQRRRRAHVPHERAGDERRRGGRDLAVGHAEQHDRRPVAVGASSERPAHRHPRVEQGARERLAHPPAPDDVAEAVRKVRGVLSRHDVRVKVRRCGEAGI